MRAKMHYHTTRQRVMYSNWVEQRPHVHMSTNKIGRRIRRQGVLLEMKVNHFVLMLHFAAWKLAFITGDDIV